jgi:metal-responsive CopG/Arc/MetJ family transcriptional regulator
MVKVTFTLDENTVGKLKDAAQRLSKPKSEIVRDAVIDYHARIGRLSEQERIKALRILADHLARPPERSQAETDRELQELRDARRRGGRRTPVE